MKCFDSDDCKDARKRAMTTCSCSSLHLDSTEGEDDDEVDAVEACGDTTRTVKKTY